MSEEPKRKQEYSNSQITVRFDPNICTHSAMCIRGLPAVFDVRRKRWIDVDADTVDRIVAQVKACPSGALTYELAHGTPEPAPEPPAEPTVTLTVVPNGSIRVTGRVRIVDLDGNLISETDKCSLCRCGHSEKKPFCDGAHKRIPWVGEAWQKPQEG